MAVFKAKAVPLTASWNNTAVQICYWMKSIRPNWSKTNDCVWAYVATSHFLNRTVNL